MDSPRADLDLVIGYDLAETGDYTAFVLMRRHEDGTLEMLEAKTPGPFARGRLLALCVESIARLKPKTVRVRIGAGDPQTISNQTVEEILGGKKTWADLMIG